MQQNDVIKAPDVVSLPVALLKLTEVPYRYEKTVSIWGRLPNGSDIFQNPNIDFPQGTLVLKFDDVCDLGWMYANANAPTQHDIQIMLDYVRGTHPENILFHCAAGLSRSPACALLCMFQYYGIDRGIECVDALFNSKPDIVPNPLIMRYGEKLLKVPMEKAIPLNKHIANRAGVRGLYI